MNETLRFKVLRNDTSRVKDGEGNFLVFVLINNVQKINLYCINIS